MTLQLLHPTSLLFKTKSLSSLFAGDAQCTSAEYPDGKLWLGGSFKGVPEELTWGDIAATDYNTGRILWKVKKELPRFGGILATAGGLILTGEGSGEFGAYDSATGKELCSYKTDAGVPAKVVSSSIASG